MKQIKHQLFRIQGDAVVKYNPKSKDGTVIRWGEVVILPPAVDGDNWPKGAIIVAAVVDTDSAGNLIVEDKDSDFYNVNPARVLHRP